MTDRKGTERQNSDPQNTTWKTTDWAKETSSVPEGSAVTAAPVAHIVLHRW